MKNQLIKKDVKKIVIVKELKSRLWWNSLDKNTGTKHLQLTPYFHPRNTTENTHTEIIIDREEPEEEPVIGATRQDTDPEMRKRIEFEEDMYMRLALTKEDKKRMNKKEREFDELQVSFWEFSENCFFYFVFRNFTRIFLRKIKVK